MRSVSIAKNDAVEHAVGDIARTTNPRPVAREDYKHLFARAIGRAAA
jgi:hypothetical protein